MERFKEESESISFEDVRAVQRLVIASSFENLKNGRTPDSVTLSDGAVVRANVYDKKLRNDFRVRSKDVVNVESANPLPQLDEVYPFIQELLKRDRKSFTVRTSLKNEWMAVRFQLEESTSEVRQFADGVAEVRNSVF
jgi:hypothetical protein